jgi:dTDP-4-dehydrorhamnose reductase
VTNKRRILVTGASGLLGLNTALEAAKAHTVYGQVNSQRLKSEAFRVIEADLLAEGAVQRLLDETQPDWVIHCAALANLDACEADPARAQKLNSEVPTQLASLVARGGARLLHVSTDAVFDGQRGGYIEQDDPHPLGVYASTKLEGERRVALADPQAIIARVNLFGWSLTGRRSLGEFFFYNLQAGQRVKGFTDVFFCPLLANHLGHIFTEMLDKRLSGLYHVVSSECTSKYDFGMAVARKFGLDESLITPTSWKEGGLTAARSPNLTLRSDKLAEALGRPLPDLSTGMEGFYSLYRMGYPQILRGMSDLPFS